MLLCAGLAILVVAAGWLYQRRGTVADRRRFPPPGRLVDIGGRCLHLLEQGHGGPAVILESGIAASCLNWSRVQTELARFTRVLSYDRAGLGWSDPAEAPRVTSQLVEELHALLSAAPVPAPYILAGHSFGGLLVRAYAAQYPGHVSGLVLVDPLVAGEWLDVSGIQARMLRRGVRLSRRGALLARLGVVRFSLALLAGGGRRVPKLIARLSSGRGESAVSRLVGEVGKMPPETWPMVQAHWCQPKSFLGMSDYLESLPASASEAAALGEPPAHIPLLILSAANSTPAQIGERDAMARHSLRGTHIVTNHGHWIHLDDPDLVVQAIRDVIELLRTRTG